MACPITVTKFVGTVSLGLLTGVSYSTTAITIPSLALLPTSTTAARCFNEVKRLNRKHALRLSSLANICFLFAYSVSPPRRKHPYLVWLCVLSTVSSYGLDLWANRHLGFKNWVISCFKDTTCISLGCESSAQKDDDLVVVGSEEGVNGESVQREMAKERRLQRARAWLAGMALSMGIVGLWGDKK
ncbi:hypothetical protein N7462_003382 [Penicillium macrosclerotiorum]|uniref:uncharacterized protein n=1 Tax=Penicillium macrosclerotiorum TaxID=303699 RepID=UPI002547C0CF|nr:uncharacterized protein N7462_003382 [Penicillium macrosclerotiorum]KAJ5688990.1 hypothetical protein N7462_003382 [Penicillium macrosclerotiorum]